MDPCCSFSEDRSWTDSVVVVAVVIKVMAALADSVSVIVVDSTDVVGTVVVFVVVAPSSVVGASVDGGGAVSWGRRSACDGSCDGSGDDIGDGSCNSVPSSCDSMSSSCDSMPSMLVARRKTAVLKGFFLFPGCSSEQESSTSRVEWQ